jgi:hypothetical protein
MSRPDFTLTWAASRPSIPPISAGNYAAGWDTYLGPLPPLGDDHDYVMNLQDKRAVWLGGQMLKAVGHEWQSDVTYDAFAVVRSPVNGQLYRSLVASNIGNEPSVSGAQWAIGVVQVSSAMPFGYFSGFGMANNSAAPTTTIDVSQGSARSSANTLDISTASTIRAILQTSGSWTAGDNQNKLDTGARAANTWYHLFAIRRTSDGAGDVLFSLSPTAPTMPSGYSGFRRIGAVRTAAGNTIIPFINIGDVFVFSTPIRDAYVTGAVANVSATVAISVPTGVRVKAYVNAATSSNGAFVYVRPVDGAAVTMQATGTVSPSWLIGSGCNTNDTNEAIGADSQVITNTSAQVVIQVGSVATTAYALTTVGYEEFR